MKHEKFHYTSLQDVRQTCETLNVSLPLAEDCGVNMMTVSKAYALLKQEAYIQTDRRCGTTVSAKKPETLPSHIRENLLLALSEAKAAGATEPDILALVKEVLS